MAGLAVNYALQSISLLDDPNTFTEVVQAIARDMAFIALFTLVFQCSVTYVMLGLGIFLNLALVLDNPAAGVIALLANYFESLVADAMCQSPSSVEWMQDIVALLKTDGAEKVLERLKV